MGIYGVNRGLSRAGRQQWWSHLSPQTKTTTVISLALVHSGCYNTMALTVGFSSNRLCLRTQQGRQVRAEMRNLSQISLQGSNVWSQSQAILIRALILFIRLCTHGLVTCHPQSAACHLERYQSHIVISENMHSEANISLSALKWMMLCLTITL